MEKSRRACFSPSSLPPLNVNVMNPVYVTKCHYFPLLARGACISRRIYICCVPEAIRNESVCVCCCCCWDRTGRRGPAFNAIVRRESSFSSYHVRAQEDKWSGQRALMGPSVRPAAPTTTVEANVVRCDRSGVDTPASTL